MVYGLNDITLIPARISTINHRSECYPYNEDGMLPLFTAPMSSIVNDENYVIFNKYKINTIIPRSVDLQTRLKLISTTFIALGLDEFEDFIQKNIALPTESTTFYICVDIAKGHMKRLLDLCFQAKQIYGGNLLLMAGNIANPDTYIEYSKVGIDFVRIGIGNGSVCTTSANSGVHYGMASLIKECVDKRWEIEKAKKEAQILNTTCLYQTLPLIIADGGFDNFDKIIKALALGADYVMLGEIFAKTLEACGEIFIGDSLNELTPINEWKQKHPSLLNASNLDLLNANYTLSRQYYGMSTKQAQKEFGSKNVKTSEGIQKNVKVEYTLESWISNFIHYLQTTMSYTNSKNLNDLQQAQYKIMSISEYRSYYK